LSNWDEFTDFIDFYLNFAYTGSSSKFMFVRLAVEEKVAEGLESADAQAQLLV
jgi:hypothetical protein